MTEFEQIIMRLNKIEDRLVMMEFYIVPYHVRLAQMRQVNDPGKKDQSDQNWWSEP